MKRFFFFHKRQERYSGPVWAPAGRVGMHGGVLRWFVSVWRCVTFHDVMSGCSWQAGRVFSASLFNEVFRSYFKFCMLDRCIILPNIGELFMGGWRKFKFTAMTRYLYSAVRMWELNGDTFLRLTMKFCSMLRLSNIYALLWRIVNFLEQLHLWLLTPVPWICIQFFKQRSDASATNLYWR